jgi:alanyl-tRNA synthetase
LRFDFALLKVTDEELQQVEDFVNIQEQLPLIERRNLFIQALDEGAMKALFGENTVIMYVLAIKFGESGAMWRIRK